MLRLLLLLALVATGATSAVPPPPESSTNLRPAPDGARFLFIVETSSSTRRLEEANRQALFDLIMTGLNGHMRTGDTFGLWTFNEGSTIGEFPMQVWDAEAPMNTASRAALFLRSQKYTGKARLDDLIPKIRGLTRAVGTVTIFIFSDGETKLEELPFSDPINTEYAQRSKERKQAKKPFITMLLAHQGKITGAFVAIAGQPIPFPERPAPTPILAKKIPLPATNLPVISPLANAAAVVTPPPLVTPVITKTAPTPPAPQESSAPVSTPPPLLAVVKEPAPSPEPEKILPPALSRPTIPPPATQPFPVLVTPSLLEPREPKLQEKPAPPSARPRSILAAALPEPTPVAARDPSPPPPRGTVAAAVPNRPDSSLLIAIGGVLLVVAAFLCAVALRQWRSAPQPSLITQSMERKQR